MLLGWSVLTLVADYQKTSVSKVSTESEETRTVVVWVPVAAAVVVVVAVVVGVDDPLLGGYVRPVEPQVPAEGASIWRQLKKADGVKDELTDRDKSSVDDRPLQVVIVGHRVQRSACAVKRRGEALLISSQRNYQLTVDCKLTHSASTAAVI